MITNFATRKELLTFWLPDVFCEIFLWCFNSNFTELYSYGFWFPISQHCLGLSLNTKQAISFCLNQCWPISLTHFYNRHQGLNQFASVSIINGGRQIHDDVIKWKHFPPYWPFVRDKGQWRGTLMFSLTCALTNSWTNNRDAGDLDAIAPRMTSP